MERAKTDEGSGREGIWTVPNPTLCTITGREEASRNSAVVQGVEILGAKRAKKSLKYSLDRLHVHLHEMNSTRRKRGLANSPYIVVPSRDDM